MEQAKIVLCDTDVTIVFYRGNDEVITELEKIGQQNIALSYITVVLKTPTGEYYKLNRF